MVIKLGYKASAEQFAPGKLLGFSCLAEEAVRGIARGRGSAISSVSGASNGGRVACLAAAVMIRMSSRDALAATR